MQMQSIGRNVRLSCSAAVGAASLALAATTVSATHYYVAPGRTGDYTADNPGGSPVEAAQKATAAGDVIHLATGLYEFENGDIMVADGVTLVGGGTTPEETVVSRIVAAPNGSTNARVIHLGRNAVMRNLTSRGGYTAYQAAGVLGYSATAGIHKSFTVSNCVVENASALYKGGGSMGGMWIDCVIRNCEVRNVSGAALYEGSGGGIWGGTLRGCVVTNNTAAYLGGGIAGNDADKCEAQDCLIAFNKAPYGAGAGVSSAYAPENCRLAGCTLEGNDAQLATGQTWGGWGGAAFNCFTTNSLIANNNSIGYGGGTYGGRNADCRISGNRGSFGGGTMEGVNIGCTICGNTAYLGQGGACYNSSTYNCLVSGNTSQEDAVLFRGYHQGDVILDNISLSGYRGSAIASVDNSTMDVAAVNCTIVGNTGTGARAQVFLAAVTNSIVVGGTGGAFEADILYGDAVHSLFGSRSGGYDAVKCIAGADPKFAKDGPTVFDCYTPLPGSPCRDAGVHIGWMDGAKDIAGNPRIKYGAVDIGALECCGGLAFTIVVK